MKSYANLKEHTDAWYRTGQYFDWDNCKIFYQKIGSGPVLLMIHGFPTAGCDWSEMAAELSKSFTIIAPDVGSSSQEHSISTRGTFWISGRTFYEEENVYDSCRGDYGA